MSVPWEAQGLIETVFSLSLGGRKLSSYGRPLSAPWMLETGQRSAQTHGTESDTQEVTAGERSCRGGWGGWASAVLWLLVPALPEGSSAALPLFLGLPLYPYEESLG